MTRVERQGTIVRVSADGTGVVTDASSGRSYYFTFDKIRGYRGESLRALALKAGSRVRYVAEIENHDTQEIVEIEAAVPVAHSVA